MFNFMRKQAKHVYRIKIEFMIDGVLYPLGAIRVWTAKDRGDFELFMNKYNQNFEMHWEKIKL